MRKSKYTEGQIAFALKQAETGIPVAEVVRKMGITEQTYYRWKKKYGAWAPPNSDGWGSSKERIESSSRWRPTSTSISTCSRKSSKKSSEACASPGVGEGAAAGV